MGLKIDDGVNTLPRKDPASANSIAQVSWYAYGQDLPGKACTNLAMNGNLTFLRHRYDTIGVPGMVLLTQSKWGIAGLHKFEPWIFPTHPDFNQTNNVVEA